MAQPIKHFVGDKTAGCCIHVNNFDIGVVQNFEYGPTSSTNFWAGYNVPSGGFLSIQEKGPQGPSYYAIPDVSSLVSYGNNMNIGVVTSPEQVLSSQITNPNLVIVNIEYPELMSFNTNYFTVDAGYTASYPWSGNVWNDIIGVGNTAVLTGNTTFVSGSSLVNYSNSSIRFNSVSQNSWASTANFGVVLGEFTINVWVNSNSPTYNGRVNIVGQQYAEPNGTPKDDCNFLIRGNGSTSLEGLIRVSGNDYVVSDPTVLPVGGWYNFTLTFDGNELKLYRDGGLVIATGAISVTPVNNGSPTLIGGITSGNSGAGSSTNYFDGDIGVVNIYYTALDAAEVQDLYDLYKTRY